MCLYNSANFYRDQKLRQAMTRKDIVQRKGCVFFYLLPVIDLSSRDIVTLIMALLFLFSCFITSTRPPFFVLFTSYASCYYTIKGLFSCCVTNKIDISIKGLTVVTLLFFVTSNKAFYFLKISR